ncbi:MULTISPECIES: PA2779 family protein [Ramlibacter]|uniref:PA2779 family protein n=1 Tax=Ramlibacter pinisoli TaxID=2682844 RepID=A0A6N8IUI3_9BURK|nr:MULTISPECIES: PA2779 family protein [Ramlibacter]MBA2965541.1 PA2779 family protein [Ramlibacter sp. CGMCC 1.13660]MVQ30507.1 PA2779 family protein [Ramlibacter pinisoli]
MQSRSRLGRPLRWGLPLILALQLPLAQADLIGPEAAMPEPATSQLEADRAKVQEFLDKANVKERLQAMGVSGVNASQRVDALTEQEVHALAQRIDGMPVGAALSQTDLILILLVAVLIIVAI